jgi:hypothetical protein
VNIAGTFGYGLFNYLLDQGADWGLIESAIVNLEI